MSPNHPNHGSNEFVKGCRHVNGIEPFWSHTKYRLAQFHGVRRDKFALHISRRPSSVSIIAISIFTRHCLNCSGMSLCEVFAS